MKKISGVICGMWPRLPVTQLVGKPITLAGEPIGEVTAARWEDEKLIYEGVLY